MLKMKSLITFILSVIIVTGIASQDPDYSNKMIQRFKMQMEYSESEDATFHDKLWLTPFLHEVYKNNDKMSTDLEFLIQEFLEHKHEYFIGTELIAYYKHYAVHYTIDGTEEENVSPVDNNFNDIPDYIDTVLMLFGDEISTLLHHELGYMIPPKDTNGFYNIYISSAEMSGGVLGFTRINDRIGDNPNSTDVIEQNSCTSTIYLRNTYSNFGNTFEYLRNTAVHEYKHAIQFGYNYRMETWFMEMCATYIETVAYPEDKVNFDHMKNFFDYPDVALDVEDYDFLIPELYHGHWYSTWVFAKFLTEHTNDTIIRNLYEQDNSLSHITFLDILLNYDWNTDFSDVFTQFIITNRLMVSDPEYYPYTYEDAESYDEYIRSHGGYRYENDLIFNGSQILYNSRIRGNQRLMRLSSEYIKLTSDQPFKISMEPEYNDNELSMVLVKLNSADSSVVVHHPHVSNYISTIEVTNPDDYTNYIIVIIREDQDEPWIFSAYYDLQIDELVVQNTIYNKYIDNLKVFPNPADDFIVLDSDVSEEYEIEVYDVFGKLVYSEHSINLNEKLINTSGLQEGAYIINIKKGNAVIMKKTIFVSH